MLSSKFTYRFNASVGVVGNSPVLERGLAPDCSRSRERLFGLVIPESPDRLTLAVSPIPAKLDLSV